MATKKPGAVADGTTLSSNRKASHEYEILDRFEAGVVLTGRRSSQSAPERQISATPTFGLNMVRRA